MTTPSATAGNSDAPEAKVALGPSDIASYLTALAGLLAAYGGKDFGIGQNAQALGLLLAGVVVFGSTIARAIKHHGAMHANAAVYAAQLAHVASVVNGQGGPTNLSALTQGVSALNTAVAADTAAPSA